MEKRAYLKLVSEINLEGCLKLPINELESFDNTINLKHQRYQQFQAKKSIFKERSHIFLKETSIKIKEEVNKLVDLPMEVLQEMLLKRSPNMQFRNLDKIEKEELIKILEEYMLLDNLENEDD